MLLKKTIPNELSVQEAEHIIGVTLSVRGQLLNYGDIASKNVSAGIVIAKAHEKAQQILTDEFDCLALFFVYKILQTLNVSDEVFQEGTISVFENFEVDKKFRELSTKRITEYKVLNYDQVGVHLLTHISIRIGEEYTPKYTEVLAKQLSDFEKILKKNILHELKALS
jgi:hypothetical protein